MSVFIELLRERLEEHGFPVDNIRLAQFGFYWRELKRWNAKINLTSITDDLEIVDKHFIDSLLLIRYEPLERWIKVADVGAGAGFPSIPIKIYQSDIQLSLLESVGKKARFLGHIVDTIGLDSVDVVNERAEVVARLPEHREQYDLVVARGVARLSVLAEYCLPLVSMGGKFVAYKGHKARAEAEEAEAALEKLGGRFERIERNVEAGLEPDSIIGRRAFVFVEKVEETPDKYPRRPGIPRKRPL